MVSNGFRDLNTNLGSHTHKYAGSSSEGGAATSANKINSNAGDANTPVYFANGVPVACTGLDLDTTGNAAIATSLSNAHGHVNSAHIRPYTGTFDSSLHKGVFFQTDCDNNVVNVGINGCGATGVNKAKNADYATSAGNITANAAISNSSNYTNLLGAGYTSASKIFTCPTDGYIFLNSWGSYSLTLYLCNSSGSAVFNTSCPAEQNKAIYMRKGSKCYIVNSGSDTNTVQGMFIAYANY